MKNWNNAMLKVCFTTTQCRRIHPCCLLISPVSSFYSKSSTRWNPRVRCTELMASLYIWLPKAHLVARSVKFFQWCYFKSLRLDTILELFQWQTDTMLQKGKRHLTLPLKHIPYSFHSGLEKMLKYKYLILKYKC